MRIQHFLIEGKSIVMNRYFSNLLFAGCDSFIAYEGLKLDCRQKRLVQCRVRKHTTRKLFRLDIRNVKVEDETKNKTFKNYFRVVLYGFAYHEVAKAKFWKPWIGTRWYGVKFGIADMTSRMRGCHCVKGCLDLNYWNL